MLFNSLEFLLFFPFVTILFFISPYRYRLPLLLLASYFFYAYWNPIYLPLILLSTFIDYYAAYRIEATPVKVKRKRWLWLSIAVNLGLLFCFKYYDFLVGQVTQFLSLFQFDYTFPALHWALPLGISFYTFQTMSYTIDVYRGHIKAEKKFGKMALYVCFFPQLIAGPIERAKSLIPQFHFRYDFDYQRVVGGLQLMLWGFFKKVVVADSIAVYVNLVYNNIESHQGFSIWVATFLFPFQIFCDFSAYSDIAIGLGRIFGIQLSKNFSNAPYFSRSIAQFWQGWHITLTAWLRSYVFFPLVKRYPKKQQRFVLILLLFFLIGFWHGADWTFIIWGLLNGLFWIIELACQEKVTYLQERLSGLGSKLLVYLSIFLVFTSTSLSGLFFRASSLEEVKLLLYNGCQSSTDWLIISAYEMWLLVIFWSIIGILHFRMKDLQMDQYLALQPTWYRWSLYTFLILLILQFGRFTAEEFVYFQF